MQKWITITVRYDWKKVANQVSCFIFLNVSFVCYLARQKSCLQPIFNGNSVTVIPYFKIVGVLKTVITIYGLNIYIYVLAYMGVFHMYLVSYFGVRVTQC